MNENLNTKDIELQVGEVHQNYIPNHLIQKGEHISEDSDQLRLSRKSVSMKDDFFHQQLKPPILTKNLSASPQSKNRLFNSIPLNLTDIRKSTINQKGIQTYKQQQGNFTTVHWRQYSSLFEALFFILMFLSVISSTIYVVAKSIGHMVENESKDWSSFGQLISLLLIFPSNYFTYRAALFNMNILKEIKRNKKYMKEKGFSKCMYHSNIVFGCNKWQKQTYSEYLIARKRSKSHFYMRDMYFKIFVIGLLICIHIYRVNQNEFKDALLPMWFFFLLIPFELQNLVLFIIKLFVFPFFFWVVVIRWYVNQKRVERQVKLEHKDLSPRGLKIVIAQKKEDQMNLYACFELDQKNQKSIYRSKYLCKCAYRLAQYKYMLYQILSMLWFNSNSYHEYKHCHFCNEQFTPGEDIFNNPQCEFRKNINDSKANHRFHIACQDILQDDFENSRLELKEAISKVEKNIDEMELELPSDVQNYKKLELNNKISVLEKCLNNQEIDQENDVESKITILQKELNQLQQKINAKKKLQSNYDKFISQLDQLINPNFNCIVCTNNDINDKFYENQFKEHLIERQKSITEYSKMLAQSLGDNFLIQTRQRNSAVSAKQFQINSKPSKLLSINIEEVSHKSDSSSSRSSSNQQLPNVENKLLALIPTVQTIESQSFQSVNKDE